MVTNSNDCFEVFCVKLCEIASNECPSVSNECQISVKVCQISAKSVPKRGKGVSKEYFISLKPRRSARTQKKPGRSSETPKKEGGQPSETPKKEGGQSSETPKVGGNAKEAGAILRNPEKRRSSGPKRWSTRNGTVGRRNGLMARRPMFFRKRLPDVCPGATGNPGNPRVRPYRPRILRGMQLLPDAACGADGRATVGRCGL